MSDSWMIANGHIAKNTAKELKETIAKKLEEIEDDDPDLLDVFNDIKDIVANACDYDYEE